MHIIPYSYHQKDWLSVQVLNIFSHCTVLISSERLAVRLSSEQHASYTVFISSKRLTVPLLGAACKLCRNYVIIKTVCPFKIGAARKLYRLHLIRKSDCPFKLRAARKLYCFDFTRKSDGPFKLRAARKSYHTQLTRKSDYPSIPLCSVVKNDCLFTAQLYSTIFLLDFTVSKFEPREYCGVSCRGFKPKVSEF